MSCFVVVSLDAFLLFLLVFWFRLLIRYFTASFTHWFITRGSFLLLRSYSSCFSFYLFTSSSFTSFTYSLSSFTINFLSFLPLPLFDCFYCLPVTISAPIYLLHPIHHSLHSFSFLPPFLHLFSGWREGGERKITPPFTRTHIRGSV